MNRLKKRRSSSLVALLLLAVTRANAAEPVEPVRIDFHAEPGCLDGAAFFQAVRARTARVRVAEDGEPARTFQVSIALDASGRVQGDLTVTNPEERDPQLGKRTIRGASCGEVFEALALFAALSVDPEASTAAVAPTAAPAIAAEPLDTPPPAPIIPTPRVERAMAVPPARTSRKNAHPSPSWGALAGFHWGAMSAGTASSLLLLAPFVEAGLHAQSRGASLAPALRLWFSSTGVDTAATSEGRAHLHWTTLRLDACPVELRAASWLAVRPCLTTSVGALIASAKIDHPENQTLLWSTLGAALHAGWNLTRSVELEGAGGLDAPLAHDSFHFRPSTPVYRVPSSIAFATIGVAVHFL